MELSRVSQSSRGGDRNLPQQANLIRERLGSALRLVDELVGTPVPAPHQGPVTEQFIRKLIKLRRNRDRFFKSDLFADPAWDMLLELYASHLGQQRISVTSLCISAAVPATTALRWVANLEENRLIVRRPDPTDGRRFFVELSFAGLEAMANYFRTVPLEANPI
jgi:DNA-binding MarR family transcriptional regulator